jgi:rare lipoprotein A
MDMRMAMHRLRGRIGQAGIAAALAASLGLGGCAQIQLGATGVKAVQQAGEPAPRGGIYKVGDPYKINGVTYYPAENYSYNETGIASFYDFHGRVTANGELYDMNSLTAAHQTLPMPSLVRVTNLENGRQLVLRVNDRGPFAGNRIIDVSRRSAQLLGFEQRGTARVRVEILADDSRQLKMALLNARQAPIAEASAAPARGPIASDALPPPAGARVAAVAAPIPPPSATLPPSPAGRQAGRPAPRPEMASARVAALPPEAQGSAIPTLVQTPVRPTALWVQAGAFSSYENAAKLGQQLRRFGAPQIMQVQSGGQRLYRVRIGPAANVPEADKLLADVAGVVPEARILVD